MKKYVLVLLIGVVCLFSGVYLYKAQGKNENILPPVEKTELSKEEATSLINDTVKNVINVYELKSEAFDIDENYVEKDPVEDDNVEESKKDEVTKENSEKDDKDEGGETEEDIEIPSGYVKVVNYDDIVKGLFTENGIKELESTSFDDNPFVIKKGNEVYLYNEIPKNNQYKNSNVSLGVIDISKDEISCDVTLSTYLMEDDDVLTYYVIVKKIKLIKNGDNWLVDTFSYKND